MQDAPFDPPLCQGPDPHPRPPRVRPPAGACDTHAHVFGPVWRYPYTPNRSFTPPDCPLEDYLAMLDVLGVERGIIVQPSAYGTDNTATLDAIARSGGRCRGIALAEPDVPDAELRRLHEGGMRGLRMTTVVKGGVSPEHLLPLADRIADLGWHLLLHIDTIDELVDLAPQIRAARCPVLVDHLGRIKGDQPLSAPGFQTLLELLLDTDHCWTKVASVYRNSRSGPPYDDMRDKARAVVAARPDRVVWGSNWPHPHHHGAMPNDGDLLDTVMAWLPDPAVRRQVFADNPAKLYGF